MPGSYANRNYIIRKGTNSLSMGFDIETGGHVFQLFFTNSYAPFEKGFITDTKGKWIDGDVRFGFNITKLIQHSIIIQFSTDYMGGIRGKSTNQ